MEGPVANKSFIAGCLFIRLKMMETVSWDEVEPQLTVFVAALASALKGRTGVLLDYSREKVETPFLSSISSTMPPPLATQVKGSSAI